MKARTLPIIPLVPLVLLALLGACGTDEGSPESTRLGSRTDTGLATVDLTEELGCGFGFARSDADEEVLLSLRHDGGSAKVGRKVSFPDPAWSAEVRVGQHLAANWCTDVIEPPEAEVEETWRVVEGTLRFEGEVPPFDWEGDPPETVRAELTGVVVESPDGERVELDDLPLRNDAWGLIPG